MSTDFDYQAVSDALGCADAELDAAQAHGVLTGIICAAGEAVAPLWVGAVFGEQADSGDRLVREAVDLLQGLGAKTRQELAEGEMALRLLLPLDDGSLAERSDALGEWCQGFLLGFGLGGRSEASLPEDVKEVLGDFVEIGKVDAEAMEENETNEAAFAEIVEYIRVGVLLMFEELQSGPSSGGEGPQTPAGGAIQP